MRYTNSTIELYSAIESRLSTLEHRKNLQDFGLAAAVGIAVVVVVVGGTAVGTETRIGEIAIAIDAEKDLDHRHEVITD